MQTKDRQKMCSQCEGRIPVSADVCPYCGAEQTLSLAPLNTEKELHHQSLQDSLTSLYSPPYTAKNAQNSFHFREETQNSKKNETMKDVMLEKRFNNSNSLLGVPSIPAEAVQEHSDDDGRSSFWPVLMLSLGANLLTIGLLQLIFSDNGFLRLEWKSSYWFAYCLAAIPLFFFGFKKANSLK